MSVYDWHEQAACAGRDDVDFFPESTSAAASRPAQRVCNGDPKKNLPPCPVLQLCHESSLHEVYGVWGGLSARARTKKREEAKAARFRV